MKPETLASLPLEQRFRLFCQWLGNQPAGGRYNFCSTSSCAMCQFVRTLEDVDERTFVSAGARSVNVGRWRIELVPDAAGFGLLRDSFGQAYSEFARRAGLPHRSFVRANLVRALARLVRHQHPLAA